MMGVNHHQDQHKREEVQIDPLQLTDVDRGVARSDMLRAKQKDGAPLSCGDSTQPQRGGPA